MKTGEIRNPGDPEPRKLIERTIRVDQAGEFGAVRIYQGQLAALRWTGRANGEAGRGPVGTRNASHFPAAHSAGSGGLS